MKACSFLIDRLKTDAPFWKKEYRGSDDGQWVAAKASDIDSAERW
jgi:molybdopterin synthase catalytic subunit